MAILHKAKKYLRPIEDVCLVEKADIFLTFTEEVIPDGHNETIGQESTFVSCGIVFVFNVRNGSVFVTARKSVTDYSWNRGDEYTIEVSGNMQLALDHSDINRRTLLPIYHERPATQTAAEAFYDGVLSWSWDKTGTRITVFPADHNIRGVYEGVGFNYIYPAENNQIALNERNINMY